MNMRQTTQFKQQELNERPRNEHPNEHKANKRPNTTQPKQTGG